ncbi:hypothetical protein LPJ66_003083, partial [Kickxella alabastrina]
MNTNTQQSQPNAQAQIPDYYDILRCFPQSTQKQIHQEYKQLALQHHPDKVAGDSQWYDIRQAYDVIGDPQKRAQYDRWRMSELLVPFDQWLVSQVQ